MSPTNNFYVLLNLALDVEDVASIENAIEAKRSEWSKALQGSAAARRKALLGLRQITEIKDRINDPEWRKAQAVEARTLQQEKRKALFEELDALVVAMVRGGGPCTRKQIDVIVGKLRGQFTEADVTNRLRARGIEIDGGPGAPKRPTVERPRLDPSRMKNINDSLAFLGQRTLYDLLEMNPRSSAKSLADKANALNREFNRVGRNDPENTERSRLYGFCLAVFSSEDEKERYDNSCSFVELEALRPLLEVAGADGFLRSEAQNHFVERSREQGVEPDEARAFIEEVARERTWGIQRDARLQAEDVPQCGYCGALARETGARRCPSCGEALILECPRCNNEVPSSRKACARCGCRLNDASTVKSLLHEGRLLAADGDFVRALTKIDQALSYWNNWKPAVAEREKIVTRRDAREKSIGGVEALLGARKLLEARAALEEVRRSFGVGGTEPISARIESAIGQAETIDQEGRALSSQGRIDEAIERYEQALELCIDLAVARRALDGMPLSGPTDLSVTRLASGYRLAWKSASEGAPRNRRFLVVRASSGRPRNHADGTKVAEVSGLQYDDLAAPGGTACYYAVFASRGHVVSTASAGAGPFLLPVDVTAAHSLAADGEITLRWALPRGAKRVEVWRAEGNPPARRGQGVPLPAAEDGLQDRGLENAKRFGYLVVVAYADPALPGRELFSPGVRLDATPASPPDPIRDLRAVRSGARILLSWTPPRLPVQIRKSTLPADVRPGTLLPLGEVARFGSLVEVRSPGTAEVSIDSQGRVVFMPLVVAGANVVVGEAALITTIDDVTALRTQTNGREIHLSWIWPTGAQEVLVAWRVDKHPGSPGEPGTNSARVSRTVYDNTSGWTLRVQKPQRHFFTVFVKSTIGELFSAGANGLEMMGQSTTVTYRVGRKKGGWLGRTVQSAWLELECDEPDFRLPAVVVIGRDGEPPLSPSDGSVLTDSPVITFLGAKATIDLPKESTSATTFVKLFFKDGRHAKEIRLLPGSNDQLRLG